MSVELLHVVLGTLFVTVWILATFVAVQNPELQTRSFDSANRTELHGPSSRSAARPKSATTSQP